MPNENSHLLVSNEEPPVVQLLRQYFAEVMETLSPKENNRKKCCNGACCCNGCQGLSIFSGGALTTPSYWQSAYEVGPKVVIAIAKVLHATSPAWLQVLAGWTLRSSAVSVNVGTGFYSVKHVWDKCASAIRLLRKDVENLLTYQVMTGNEKLTASFIIAQLVLFIVVSYLAYDSAEPFFQLAIQDNPSITWWQYGLAGASLAINWAINIVGIDATWTFLRMMWEHVRFTLPAPVGYNIQTRIGYKVRSAYIALLTTLYTQYMEEKDLLGKMEQLKNNDVNVLGQWLTRPAQKTISPDRNRYKDCLKATGSIVWLLICLIILLIFNLAQWGYIKLAGDASDQFDKNIELRWSTIISAAIAFVGLTTQSTWETLSSLGRGPKSVARYIKPKLFFSMVIICWLLSAFSGGTGAETNWFLLKANMQFGITMVVAGYLTSALANFFYGKRFGENVLSRSNAAAEQSAKQAGAAGGRQIKKLIQLAETAPPDRFPALHRGLTLWAQNNNVGLQAKLKDHGITEEELTILQTGQSNG